MTPSPSPSTTERLQKVLAAAGVASRRGCIPLIQDGHVRVNGATVTEPGFRVDPARDRIDVDGRPVCAEPHCTYLADKPRGILCTSSDPRGRPTIVEWARRNGAHPALRLYSVGRLDFDSEGLLLLTNDGDLAQALAHPRNCTEKEYRVWTSRLPDSAQRRALLDGIDSDGECLRALDVSFDSVRPGQPPSFRMTLGEGRNREIRRMMEALSLRVFRLRRIRIGTLTEADLRHRPLRLLPPAELATLLSPS